MIDGYLEMQAKKQQEELEAEEERKKAEEEKMKVEEAIEYAERVQNEKNRE